MSMPRGKKILVTGGAGFIGRKVVRKLVEQGYAVVVLGHLSPGYRYLIDQGVYKEVRWVDGDTCNQDLVEKLVKGKDAIIHLATETSSKMYERQPVEKTTSAVQGFQRVLESMKRCGVEKIVYASSCAVYEGCPLDQSSFYHESISPVPSDLKSLSKIINEETAHYYSRTSNILAIGLRIFPTYGEEGFGSGHGSANTVLTLVKQMASGEQPEVWGDGTQVRDFIYVDDVARSFLLALSQNLNTQEFNIGTGKGTSINELVELINRNLKTKLVPKYITPTQPHYAPRIVADPTKAKDLLGFSFKMNLPEGLALVIDSVRK